MLKKIGSLVKDENNMFGYERAFSTGSVLHNLGQGEGPHFVKHIII